MSGVHLHSVKARLNAYPRGIAEGLGHLLYVLPGHSAEEGRGVEIESAAGTYRSAVAGAPVGHIAAVAELYAGLRALGVYGIGELPEVRDYLIPEQELRVEGEAAFADCRIGDRSHSYPSFRNGNVIVEKFLGRAVVLAHRLEGGGTYGPVAQFQIAQSVWCEKRIHFTR